MTRRKSQRERILDLLRNRHGQWVELPEILDLRISQYGARIFSLRRAGHVIENRQEGDHSWFRLVGSKPIETGYENGTKMVRKRCEKTSQIQQQPAESLFGDLSPLRYPD